MVPFGLVDRREANFTGTPPGIIEATTDAALITRLPSEFRDRTPNGGTASWLGGRDWAGSAVVAQHRGRIPV